MADNTLSREEMEAFIKMHLGIHQDDGIRLKDIYDFILVKERIEYEVTRAYQKQNLTKEVVKEIKAIVSVADWV